MTYLLCKVGQGAMVTFLPIYGMLVPCLGWVGLKGTRAVDANVPTHGFAFVDPNDRFKSQTVDLKLGCISYKKIVNWGFCSTDQDVFCT